MKNPERIEQIERIEDQTEAQYRSATQAAAVLAAPLVYHAGGLAKDWVQDKLSKEPPPKIELPPGVERD